MPLKVVNGATVLARRRRPRARRLRDADQHRARQRPARDLSRDPQEGERVDAGGRSTRRKDLLPAHQGGRAARASSSSSTSISRSSCAPPSRASLREAVDRRRAGGADDPASSSAAGAARSSSAPRSRWRSSSASSGSSSTGQTLNLMTLGGLALAVGMLVDDATVEIENIHRNRGLGKPLLRAHPRRRAPDRGAGARGDD